ncbi:MAG: addiction module protein [Terriglobia bacterium]
MSSRLAVVVILGRRGNLFMSKRGSQLLDEALALPPSERAEIAGRLLRSLEPSTQDEIDKLWALESEGRLDPYNRGDIHSIPAARLRSSQAR